MICSNDTWCTSHVKSSVPIDPCRYDTLSAKWTATAHAGTFHRRCRCSPFWYMHENKWFHQCWWREVPTITGENIWKLAIHITILTKVLCDSPRAHHLFFHKTKIEWTWFISVWCNTRNRLERLRKILNTLLMDGHNTATAKPSFVQVLWKSRSVMYLTVISWSIYILSRLPAWKMD